MLVVEDEPTALAALRKYFSGQGYSVDYAREIEEAEALVVTSRYDIVIADLRLSFQFLAEGLELLRFVKQRCRETKVIILTAHGSPDIQRSARVLGAGAFLQKPTPLPEIAATVSRLLETA